MPEPASLEDGPPLILPTTDLLSLRAVVTATRPPDPQAAVAAWLAEELDRAAVVAPEVLPPRVVTLHATVSHRNDVTDPIGCVTRVYHGEEDADDHAVSVLSPVGAALIGLSEGNRSAGAPRRGAFAA
ncbi:GreA/GreB family elongation factor [Methylobacterium sp. Leaf118]|uniref:GreA/GreB family elongation factor n=1 Tax=Methylobacterium sp. Leaf118 TaxID=2876562 RepID=UPI001E312EBF|nr:GreA/GreB family elongation factor [Methylobacterium sp. Leaf118]